MFAFFARWGWAMELASHFRAHYALALIVLSAVWSYQRRWSWTIACGITAMINLIAVCRSCWLPGEPAYTSGASVRLASINVTSSNKKLGLALKWIKEVNPDVLLIMEIREERVHEFDCLRSTYPHVIIKPRADDFGIALFSRLPIRAGSTVELGDSGVPSVEAELVADGIPFHIIGLHAIPPSTPNNNNLRNAQFQAAANKLRQLSIPAILCGDFNCTPWNPWFSELLNNTNLKDTERGYRLLGSWPAWLPVFRLPIDHCLVSKSINVLDRQLGPYVGGDHLPLLIDLIVPSEAR